VAVEADFLVVEAMLPCQHKSKYMILLDSIKTSKAILQFIQKELKEKRNQMVHILLAGS
jgi:hypothetical protein